MKKKLLLTIMIFVLMCTSFIDVKQAESAELDVNIGTTIDSSGTIIPYVEVQIGSNITAYIYTNRFETRILIVSQTFNGFHVAVSGEGSVDSTGLELVLNVLADLSYNLSDGLVVHITFDGDLLWDSTDGLDTDIEITPYLSISLGGGLTFSTGLTNLSGFYAVLRFTSPSIVASLDLTSLNFTIAIPLFNTEVNLSRTKISGLERNMLTNTELILSRGTTDLSGPDIERIKEELLSVLEN